MITFSKDSRGFGIIEVIISVFAIVVIIIALFACLGVYRHHHYPYVFNGPSMMPTINNGQRVTVNLGHYSNPKVGDIVLFYLPNPTSYGQPKNIKIMKRIVALQDDKVVIKNDKFTVYNSNHPNGYDPDDTYGLENQITSGSVNIVVPRNEIFVLGDNRPDSLDSRAFGTIALSVILGQVTKY